MAVNISRREQIDFLLRRRFGTLAPPPVPTLRESQTDAAMREASYRRSLAMSGTADPRPAMQSASEEYQALSADALQKLYQDAKAEDTQKAQERFEKFHAEREKRWPHWAKKDLWSEAEFAALCCGFIPDETGMASDPMKGVLPEGQALAIKRAAGDIRRGTLSRTLTFIPRDDADTAARMYGTARHYVPAIAAEWAATRFDSFPVSLLNAVRTHALDAARGAAVAGVHAKTTARPLRSDREHNMLLVIRALLEIAELPKGEETATVMPTLRMLGFEIPKDDKTIRNPILAARELIPERIPKGA